MSKAFLLSKDARRRGQRRRIFRVRTASQFYFLRKSAGRPKQGATMMHDASITDARYIAFGRRMEAAGQP